MKRLAERILKEWLGNRKRKPLIIRGARQVGKSTLMQMLAKDKKHRFINLEDPRDLAIFNDGYTSFIKEVKEDPISQY